MGTIVATNFSWAAYAWGGGSSNSDSSLGKFYENDAYEWFHDSSNLAMKVEGCVWATSDDNEDLGCMQDSSNDGVTYWYQMAMCRRAQVAYSVYASNSGSPSCSSGNFKGTVSSFLLLRVVFSFTCEHRLLSPPALLTHNISLTHYNIVRDTRWSLGIYLHHGNLQ